MSAGPEYQRYACMACGGYINSRLRSGGGVTTSYVGRLTLEIGKVTIQPAHDIEDRSFKKIGDGTKAKRVLWAPRVFEGT
jgi:hypothetical protein